MCLYMQGIDWSILINLEKISIVPVKDDYQYYYYPFKEELKVQKKHKAHRISFAALLPSE